LSFSFGFFIGEIRERVRALLDMVEVGQRQRREMVLESLQKTSRDIADAPIEIHNYNHYIVHTISGLSADSDATPMPGKLQK